MTVQTREFEADTGKILNIVINSLYSNKEIFLRELLSNASDAINKRQYLGQVDGALLNSGDSGIGIKINKKAKTIEISDTGIGLDDNDLAEALGTIARSGTKAFIERLEEAKDKKDEKLNLIGQFGVGFYSSFMVADKVDVISRKAGTEQSFLWSSDGQSGYSIAPETSRDTAGTTVILHLKKDAKEYIEDARIKTLIKKYSDHIPHPITLTGTDGESAVVNSAEAIWTKSPKDISDEDYTQFYQSNSGNFDTPFITIHNKSEGSLEFTNLLFIPNQAPFDLFEPERKTKLQLYINRVFITSDLGDLLPQWLRFVRGIIDTPSLDLNVSREILQHSPTLTKIKKAITKKVMSELEKKLKKDPESFDTFWQTFGRVIKEGLYEDHDNRDRLLKISRLYSHKQDKFVTLQEYVDQMAENQKSIYYLASENLTSAKRSPHLEGFAENGIDVLLLTDPIDEFWVSMVPHFSDKPLTSISREKVDLSEFSENEKTPENKASEETYSDLLEKTKAILGEAVSDIRMSSTLTSSPARLVAGEGGLDFNLERILKAQNPDYQGTAKVLELNPSHPLIEKMNAALETNADVVADTAQVLLQQARILDGELPDDPGEFAKQMTNVMLNAL